ncbi:DUF4139 domain-containing protein [Tuwongella immobilis]|uniref:Uncharacterized protein n=1 Tax=Tuwongella immobilis TaxID=692036 RepID=A0A6C2YJJ5_9BACT|nr:DUF4139 domain-containing protein [Tuwongella immobilis]VIP01132.1 Uncharacterized protein OS=Pirellula staleyi (strain ATCC 27377 / DSM 6068 / ICPB 4128) GN=Psta_3290 PE=4 SV=1: DUF4139: DUF4139 [Tuwongella immobilis]VTR97689.1 Uncharacterized protein OS=Pirellula staleyi (strain ATCC 27377 / DSM 6068 / ICPB 4128) GN=Psta_3290 PE=4 SV=1: DUF4139: DUF4139 [Tuwongella immobilis]
MLIRLRKVMLFLTPVLGAATAAMLLSTATGISAPGGEKQTELKTAVGLPISRVALFSSGVGYFARSGDVDGNVRVDLTFPERDINDLLKSMTLEDFGDGQVSAVSYDSREPIDRTLASFAINLNNNPTLGQILTQARGEQVEVVLQQNVVGQPGTISGKIVGLETQRSTKGEDVVSQSEVLNLWCADGMRAVKLSDVQRLRFVNPTIEAEVRRALEVLSLNHDQQKKAVSLHFTGQGRRKVQVGYVVENPIWKTSYRLVLDKDGKEVPKVQGWAIVENPTDEDWNGVEMSLISGRPISFKMDLYNPLYVNRPTVEPELFASLRPPTYSGDMMARNNLADMPAGNLGGFGGGAGFAGGGIGGPGNAPMPAPMAAAAPMAPSPKMALPRMRTEQLLKQQAETDRFNFDAVQSAATAAKLGDNFSYNINKAVDLARQKSALLPIIAGEIEAKRVSIYNASVQAKHPLLGLRLKNTTGVHLMQGPITVFEGATYAGDTRVLDIQPKEERLVSYAIDLGTEVNPVNGDGTSRITQVKVQKGIVITTTRFREEKTYQVVNRSQTDRTLLVEHPNRKNQGFNLVNTVKPVEETAELWRFEMPVAAGKSGSLTVAEERDQGTSIAISNSNDDQIRFFVSQAVTSEAVKIKLQEAMALKAKVDNAKRELQKVEADIQRITQDQNRLRQNLREVPQASEAYKRYLKKFDDQEKEMDGLTTQQKELQNSEFQARVAYETFLANLTVE